jgi:hypothetical protein
MDSRPTDLSGTGRGLRIGPAATGYAYPRTGERRALGLIDSSSRRSARRPALEAANRRRLLARGRRSGFRREGALQGALRESRRTTERSGSQPTLPSESSSAGNASTRQRRRHRPVGSPARSGHVTGRVQPGFRNLRGGTPSRAAPCTARVHELTWGSRCLSSTASSNRASARELIVHGR